MITPPRPRIMCTMVVTYNDGQMVRSFWPNREEAQRTLESLTTAIDVDKVELYEKAMKQPYATGYGEHSRSYTPSMFRRLIQD